MSGEQAVSNATGAPAAPTTIIGGGWCTNQGLGRWIRLWKGRKADFLKFDCATLEPLSCLKSSGPFDTTWLSRVRLVSGAPH